ncbi:hypothetical protein ACFL35_17010 [Candidatus Riflebacteria bacterium]
MEKNYCPTCENQIDSNLEGCPFCLNKENPPTQAQKEENDLAKKLADKIISHEKIRVKLEEEKKIKKKKQDSFKAKFEKKKKQEKKDNKVQKL